MTSLEGEALAGATVPATAGRTGLWSVRAAGFAGLAFSVLFITALVELRDSPPAADSDVLRWYATARDRILFATYLIPFAGIAFLWFLAVVRRRIGRAEDQFFSTVFLATGLLFTAMLFTAGAAATSSASLAFAPGDSAAGDAQFIAVTRTLAQTVFYGFAIKMAAAFMLVTSSIGMRAGALPRWFAVLGIVAALVMLVSIGFLEPIAIVFPVWVGAVSVLLLRVAPEAWASA
jgi:hypothetical protein